MIAILEKSKWLFSNRSHRSPISTKRSLNLIWNPSTCIRTIQASWNGSNSKFWPSSPVARIFPLFFENSKYEWMVNGWNGDERWHVDLLDLCVESGQRVRCSDYSCHRALCQYDSWCYRSVSERTRRPNVEERRDHRRRECRGDQETTANQCKKKIISSRNFDQLFSCVI